MLWLVIASILLIIVALLFHRQGLFSDGDSESGYPMSVRHHLLSPTEKSFYAVLLKALSNHALVFPKVEASKVLVPRESLVARDFKKMQEKLRGRFFDFVICHRSDLQILGVVSLLNRKSTLKSEQEAASFVAKACTGARLKLFRFDAERNYDLKQVKDVFRYPASEPSELQVDEVVEDMQQEEISQLKTDNAETREQAYKLSEIKNKAASLRNQGEPLKVEQPARGVEKPAAEINPRKIKPNCPRCGKQLLEKEAKHGARKGSVFIHCTDFPGCKFVFMLGR